MNPSSLPTTHQLTLAYALSLIVAVLMTAVSLASLLFSSTIYPTDDLRNASIPTDVVNLLIGLPILLGSMALARRGKLIGLLFWPGALLFVVYHYIAFSVGALITWQLIPYLVLVTLSVYTIVSLLSSIDAMAVRQQLTGAVRERFTGGALVGFGALFAILAIQILSSQTASAPERATAVADLVIVLALAAGGILLWRKQALGYVVGAGLLFQVSMLFVGLLAYFILQPFLTEAPFPAEDFVVILVMGLICSIPFVLFVRCVTKSQG
ncbi:MAG: hypothetical protein JXB07_10540 [Anaerolineae bacterium]|nr:hypothetical protein [Anaerolineae bacterium]